MGVASPAFQMNTGRWLANELNEGSVALKSARLKASLERSAKGEKEPGHTNRTPVNFIRNLTERQESAAPATK